MLPRLHYYLFLLLSNAILECIAAGELLEYFKKEVAKIPNLEVHQQTDPDNDEYTIENALVGEGYDGYVRRVKHKTTGIEYARKEVFFSDLKVEKSVDRILFEIKTYSLCRDSEDIVHLQEVYYDKLRIFIVLEYMSGETLQKYINDNGGKIADVSKVKRLLKPIANGIKILHHHKIMWRNLKPDNILLDASGRPKISDMGFAAEAKESTHVFGTPYYIAPEMIKRTGYNKEIDVWSLGVMVVYLITGHYIFYPGKKQMQNAIAEYKQTNGKLPNKRAENALIQNEYYNNVLNKEIKSKTGITDQNAAEFAEWILEREPSNRPTANAVAGHSFLSV
ncbi:protein kinase domain-containing protein [Ditylenchus destructor]|uniref:Protein kinase domain-containing protein n=1 Tax=Ditylenchus destructor TaxID=166010 RepID=A0AAD4MQM5_9BILA|nr:protein kinase domain-containing protein [Ditylenchus destructor]